MFKKTNYGTKSIELNIFILTLLALISVISIIYNQNNIIKVFEPKLTVYEDDLYNYLNDNLTFSSKYDLKECEAKQSELKGKMQLNLTLLDEKEIINQYISKYDIKPGGKWKPKNCKQNSNYVAIVIPYRDREEHLNMFLFNMLPLFIRQNLTFGIYLIEPINTIKFNRGLLLNIGFLESNKDANNLWKCHAFHDIDLLSQNDYTLYTCPQNPTHLSHRINKFNYSIMKNTSFGGVTIVNKEQFIDVNGYSNLFFGWGGEDNDHQKRFSAKGYEIVTPSPDYNRYYMHKHEQDTPNIDRYKILNGTEERYQYEGLNSIKYKIIEKIIKPFYVKIKVFYNQTELFDNFEKKKKKKDFHIKKIK